LCVGEAQVFDATFRAFYNTAFDRSLLEQWCGSDPIDVAALRDRLDDNRVDWVLVNWSEILRYRDSGYGYAEWVDPGRIDELQRLGVLGPDRSPGRWNVQLEQHPLTPRRLAELRRWAPSLLRRVDGHEVFVAMQVFPVLAGPSGTP